MMRVWLLVTLLLAGAAARADSPVQTIYPARLAQARAEFLKGAELVDKLQWAEALAAFERSSALRAHPVSTYNIGVCERALGQYTRARTTLKRALDESSAAAADTRLPASLQTEATGLVAEIDRLLARVVVTVVPAEAAIAVDGRPLQTTDAAGARPTLVAGALPPGPGAPPPAGTFELIANPGVHVITLSRKGYTDAVARKSLTPGSTSELRLELEKLPATLHVTANQSAALVAVDDLDIGPTPVDVLRPAGSYRVTVRKQGFVPYRTDVTVRAGEEANLQAALPKEKLQLAKKWWFWTSLVAVVAVGATLTYVFTRPPPPYDGGNTNWVAMPALR
jgi:hypothetical protein